MFSRCERESKEIYIITYQSTLEAETCNLYQAQEKYMYTTTAQRRKHVTSSKRGQICNWCKARGDKRARAKNMKTKSW